eukprot:6200653-Pleurochrysis_carterae.AAC.7
MLSAVKGGQPIALTTRVKQSQKRLEENIASTDRRYKVLLIVSTQTPTPVGARRLSSIYTIYSIHKSENETMWWLSPPRDAVEDGAGCDLALVGIRRLFVDQNFAQDSLRFILSSVHS